MQIQFFKYQGTGNDFIIVDNRQLLFDKNDTKHIERLCDRRFGIGADGLILLENHKEYDFKMVYFNSDGNESSMCGNGGRCITAFANKIGIIENKAIFEAIDGEHSAEIHDGMVKLQMQNVSDIKTIDDHFFIDTGSPHVVKLQNNVNGLDLLSSAKEIRYSEPYAEKGVNINFIEQLDLGSFLVRTYERGVEDETLSCGTGVTAAALFSYITKLTTDNSIKIKTKGGDLVVNFTHNDGKFTDIWLVGPAQFVFKGSI